MITSHKTSLLVYCATVILTGCATSVHNSVGNDGGDCRDTGPLYKDAETSVREESGSYKDAETSVREESGSYEDAETNDRDGRDAYKDAGSVVQDSTTADRDGNGGGEDSGSVAECQSQVIDVAEVTVFQLGRGELGMGTEHASIHGVVTDLGEGIIPSDVTIRDWQTDAADTQWIRIAANDAAEWVVLGGGLPYGFSVARDSVVSAQYIYTPGGFGPDEEALWLNVDDALAFYFGQAGRPSDLELPQGVVVSQGEPLCQAHHVCGDYALYALDVKLDGGSVTLETGQSATAGNYDVWHMYTQYQTSSTNECSDWYIADTVIAIAHRVSL